MRDTKQIEVSVQKRVDGEITVRVQLVGWPVQYLTSLGHNKLLQSRIANKIALAVYGKLLQDSGLSK